MPAYLCSLAAIARAEAKLALITVRVLPDYSNDLKIARTAGSPRQVSAATAAMTTVISVSVTPDCSDFGFIFSLYFLTTDYTDSYFCFSSACYIVAGVESFVRPGRCNYREIPFRFTSQDGVKYIFIVIVIPQRLVPRVDDSQQRIIFAVDNKFHSIAALIFVGYQRVVDFIERTSAFGDPA